jgi:Fic family protein
VSRLLRRFWEPEFVGIDVPRRDRQGCNYEAYVPDPLLHREFLFEGAVAADISDAEAAVTELDRRAVALVDTEALARLLLRAESVASSRIEGLEIGPRRILQADATRDEIEQHSDVTAKDVLANIDAMTFALKVIGKGDAIKPDHLLETHRRLLAPTRLAEHAGVIRNRQNWIGGSIYNPCNAAFIPPPPEFVEELLADLCAFCNTDTLPAIAQAAIAHAQFETIHPFVDGNGRVGRALIHMVLRRRGLTSRVTPPVSLVLATRAEEYVKALMKTRYAPTAAPEHIMRTSSAWVELFATSSVRAVRDAEQFELRIGRVVEAWYARLGKIRSHSAVHALIRILPGAPILTVKTAVHLTGRSLPAINDAVAQLVAADILRESSNRARNRTFEAQEIIDAFTDLERQLASPVGNTRIEAPVRRVPRRTLTRRQRTNVPSSAKAKDVQ